MQGRAFLLAVILVAAAATVPARGQAIEQTSSGAQGAASVPDFSGIWARLSFPGFEPLASGPTSLVNRSRSPNGAGEVSQLVGDYTNPILKPQAAEVVKKYGEMSLAGVTFPNPRNQCWPGGVPYVFTNLGMQMIQLPDRITILYSDDHEVRRVRLNESHPARVMPSWYGDSVGHYEGDTLVIDTVGIKIGPYAMVDWYGTPYTEALHVVERYRLLDYDAAIEAEKMGERENNRIEVSGSTGFSRDPTYKGKGLDSVDHVSGMTKGWSSKTIGTSPIKRIGALSLAPMLGALGLKLALVVDEEAFAKIRPRLAQRKTARPCGREPAGATAAFDDPAIENVVRAGETANLRKFLDDRETSGNRLAHARRV